MTSYEPIPATAETTCYRHPDRPSGVSCQRCERYICSQCMHQASVGVHCPECTRNNKQKVYTRHTLPGHQAKVTRFIIGLNLVVFVLQLLFFGATFRNSGTAALELGTNGFFIDRGGEWWRIVTGGFGHFGVVHLAMNMYSLYVLGPLLERRLGPVRFALAYAASLVGGSFGALLVAPNALTMGASGAIFGLLGLVVMMHRSEGISIAQTSLGPVLLVNVFITLSGYVSLGGHAGGFVTGMALGAMYFGADRQSGPLFGRDQVKPDIVTGVTIVALFAASVLIAGTWQSPVF